MSFHKMGLEYSATARLQDSSFRENTMIDVMCLTAEILVEGCHIFARFFLQKEINCE